MKKNYMKPEMFAVTLQHQDRILQSVSQIDSEVGSGGGDGSGLEIEAKGSKNIWDEEW